MPIVPFQTTCISTILHVPRLCCHYLFPAQWDYSVFQLFSSFLNKCSPIHLYTAARQAYNFPFLTETLFKFPLFIHLNKYLLSTYYMTVLFLPADHTVINKINKVNYTELPSETWLKVKYWSWELKVPAKMRIKGGLRIQDKKIWSLLHKKDHLDSEKLKDHCDWNMVSW